MWTRIFCGPPTNRFRQKRHWYSALCFARLRTHTHFSSSLRAGTGAVSGGGAEGAPGCIAWWVTCGRSSRCCAMNRVLSGLRWPWGRAESGKKGDGRGRDGERSVPEEEENGLGGIRREGVRGCGGDGEKDKESEREEEEKGGGGCVAEYSRASVKYDE